MPHAVQVVFAVIGAIATFLAVIVGAAVLFDWLHTLYCDVRRWKELKGVEKTVARLEEENSRLVDQVVSLKTELLLYKEAGPYRVSSHVAEDIDSVLDDVGRSRPGRVHGG